jgi:hypothetical protein
MPEIFEGDLAGAIFRNVNLENARFRGANMTGVKISDAWCVNVDVDAMVFNFVVNGVDVLPYVKQELDKRYPIRLLLKPTDPESAREAWAAIEELWAGTVAKAQQMPEEKLHESVDEEWSFVQTLQHLVMAMDKWFTVPVLGGTMHSIGLPNTGTPPDAFPGIDLDAKPTFADALAVRAERMAMVRDYLATATPDDFAKKVPVTFAGVPPVQACLHVVLDEEWAHNRYAERDLAILSR